MTYTEDQARALNSANFHLSDAEYDRWRALLDTRRTRWPLDLVMAFMRSVDEDAAWLGDIETAIAWTVADYVREPAAEEPADDDEQGPRFAVGEHVRFVAGANRGRVGRVSRRSPIAMANRSHILYAYDVILDDVEIITTFGDGLAAVHDD